VTELREEQSRVAASLRDQIASLTSKMETLLNQTSEATVPAQSTMRRTAAPASTSRTSTQSTPAQNVSLRTDQHNADRHLVYEGSLDVLETSEIGMEGVTRLSAVPFVPGIPRTVRNLT
jgi:hypothetical protein